MLVIIITRLSIDGVPLSSSDVDLAGFIAYRIWRLSSIEWTPSFISAPVTSI